MILILYIIKAINGIKKINNDDLETFIAYVLCFRLLNIAIEYLLFIQNQFHNFFQFFH